MVMRWLLAATVMLTLFAVLVGPPAKARAAGPTTGAAADAGAVREVDPRAVHPRQLPPEPDEDDAGREAAARLRHAERTQASTRARLRVLGDADTCAQARYVAYRRSHAEPTIVDQWYLASQLWADAVLLAAPDPRRSDASAGGPADRCHLDKGFIFLDRLWDVETGGYYPRSDLTGTAVERGVRFTDDNSLAGLALLDAAGSVNSVPARQRYLHAARREAEFLMTSGLWDETFGGGFWWNTHHGDTGEGKPTQSNALAALFFARLYRETGVEAYRAWSLRTIDWADAVLYDPVRQLYRWSVSYADPAARTGAIVHERYFNYDQGIAIEAQLEAARLDAAPGRRGRARDVGEAVHAAFWGQERGGYNLEAGIEQVYTAYAAWTSRGHLALYRSEGDPRWLDLARRNADALADALHEGDGSYAYRHYRCVDVFAPGCESGLVRSVVDHTLDTSAQAWPQHLQALLGTVLWPDAGAQRELVVHATGNGGTIAGPGIACGADCSESYALGTRVTLTASPAPGSVLVGWGGACSGVGSCVVAMDDDRDVTATFAPAPRVLTVATDGAGIGAVTSDPPGIACGADCSEAYLHGTSIALTAAPDAGSVFLWWGGGCSGTGSCRVTMDAARSVTATFGPAPPRTFTLTVSRQGNGTGTVTSAPAGIGCGTDCTEAYPSGSEVTLTAVPAEGGNMSAFAGWGGPCDGTATCRVTMDAEKTVTATFRRVDAGVSVGRPALQPSGGGPTLEATLAARPGCGPIDHVQFGDPGRPLDNAVVSVTGGPSNRTAGFTHTPPRGTAAVTLTIRRAVPSGGATISPVVLVDGCGEWRTFVGGGAEAFH
jgi:Fe-S cluster biogenesis protein NfuA